MAISATRVYTWYISLVAAMCMVLYGYDASVFNAAQGSEHWLEWFDLDVKKDANLLGLVNTSYTIGAIVSGWFLGGPLSDYLGRRWGMAIGCLLTIIATFVQAFAPWHNIGCFIGGRVLIGIGQGIALTSGPIYIGEVAPAGVRGKIMTFWQLFYSVGSFICFWIAYATNLHREKLGHWDWRLIVIFQILVPIIVCILLPFQPESPRWWIQRHNNIEEAKKAMRKIRETEQEVEEEVLLIREAIEYEKEAISGTYFALFKDPSIRKRLYLVFILNIAQQLSGQGTLNTYSSSIYKNIWSSDETINLINALNATFGILFTLNAMWTADRYGRRWLFLVGAAGMGVCMMIVPIVGLTTPDVPGPDGTTTKTQPVGISIVFLLFLFIFFYKPSWGATVWIYTAEVFSMNVRAQAVGMCSQMQNVANTIFQQFFPIFLANEGITCLFFFMAANFLMIAYVWFFIPETKKVPLEEMDALFGGQSHVTEGSQMVKADPAIADRNSKDDDGQGQEHRENKEA